MTPFRLYFYERKARPRSESRLIRVKSAKSGQNARKRKSQKKKLQTRTELETAKHSTSQLNCNTPSASSRKISEKTRVETVINESVSKLKEINEKLKQELQETCNALYAETENTSIGKRAE